MKDYSFGKNKEFILGYEVKDGQIIVKYAKNKSISFLYSKEKEIKILNKMKVQDEKNYGLSRNVKEEMQFSIGLLSVSSVVAAMVGVLFGHSVPGLIIMLIFSGVSLIAGIEAILAKIYVNDIKKINYFWKINIK